MGWRPTKISCIWYLGCHGPIPHLSRWAQSRLEVLLPNRISGVILHTRSAISWRLVDALRHARARQIPAPPDECARAARVEYYAPNALRIAVRRSDRAFPDNTQTRFRSFVAAYSGAQWSSDREPATSRERQERCHASV